METGSMIFFSTNDRRSARKKKTAEGAKEGGKEDGRSKGNKARRAGVVTIDGGAEEKEKGELFVVRSWEQATFKEGMEVVFVRRTSVRRGGRTLEQGSASSLGRAAEERAAAGESVGRGCPSRERRQTGAAAA